MQARELMDLPAGDSAYGSLSTDTNLNARKLKEASEWSPKGKHTYVDKGEETLEDNIRKHGVKMPVTLSVPYFKGDEPMIDDGHHRVAVANKVNPESWIPVQYSH